MKKKKQTLNGAKVYQGNRSNVKGRLFELALNKLLVKSGFIPEIDTDQLTRNQKRLHGRGATYDPDVLGQFSMGIPFVNPLMLVGEAKNYNHQVKLSNAREFLGAYMDFSQYQRLNTKARTTNQRYADLYNTRFTYCPIYFSVKGFQKSAEGFMFVHGINYISYQHSDVFKNIFKLIDSVLDRLKFSQFQKDDFIIFSNLERIGELRSTLKKSGFDKTYARLITYLTKISSLIGVLDRKYPVHILYEKSISASLFKKIRLTPDKNDVYILENTAGRKFGEFSLSNTFLKEYVAHAKKKEGLDKIFKQIDVVIYSKGTWEIRQLLIEDESRELLISRFDKDFSNKDAVALVNQATIDDLPTT